MRTNLFATTALVLALSIPSLAAAQQDKAQGQQQGQQAQQAGSSQNQQAQVPQEAKQFAEFAAMDGMFEVRIGEMAQDKAQNQKVKDFAQTLVKDHKEASDKLKTLAQDKGMDLPQELGQEHQKKLDQLKNASGAEFDKQFVEMNVKGHEQAIQKFESYAKEGKVEELKSFAENTTPTLDEHLKTAQDLQQEMQQTASASGASGQSSQPQGQQDQQQAQAGGGPEQEAQVTVVTPPAEPTQQDQAEVTVVEPAGERQPEVAVVQPEPEAAQPAEQAIAAAPATDTISFENLLGREVVGSDGEELGEIEDVILDAQSREARQVVIGSGGFLGIGEKKIALDMDQLEIGEDRVVAGSLTQAGIEGLDEYQDSDSVVSLRRESAGDAKVKVIEPAEPKQ